jgi:hypothetical protein
MAIRVGTQPILRFYAGPVPPPTPAETYIAAVLAAGGTLSGAQQTAIETFYNSLDTAGIYSKISAMYPFLGGVAASNAIDFVNPGGGFDLTFVGTWTHSNLSGSQTTPSLGNYANTSFNPTTDATSVTTDFSFGVCAATGSDTGYHGLGNATANFLLVGDFSLTDTFFGSSRNIPTSNGFSQGAFTAVSRTGLNSWIAVCADNPSGGTLIVSATQVTAYTPYNDDVWLGRINGLGNFPGGGALRFAFIGTGMNSTELQDLSDAMNTLQTAFSRNIWT